MLLAWLLKNIVYRLLCGTVEIPVRDIIYDSRKDAEGCVFVCLKGYYSDGHDFAADVMSRGARAVVIRESLSPEKKSALWELARDHGVCLVCVKDTRTALSEMSRALFEYPEKKLTLIGVTGTKGKTTVAAILKHILERAGIRTGLIGTLGIFDGKHYFSSDNTTPESYLVQKYLRMMADQGCKAAVMEVSSQALMCGRVSGVFFDYAVMTNISPDHIGPGEHHSFEDYMYWKSRLFSQCQIGIANGADAHVLRALTGCSCHLELFAVREAHMPEPAGAAMMPEPAEHIISVEPAAGRAPVEWEACALKTVLEPEPGIYFKIVRTSAGSSKETAPLFLSLPGTFNVSNALAAVAVARHMGVPYEIIAAALKDIHICGRCELLCMVNGGYFILDYAHNGKALESVLKMLRQYHPARLICIFGCGGNRSRLRRSAMAQAAARGADRLIITTDNPRYEVPAEIMRDIEKEILKLKDIRIKTAKPGFYTMIEDRREAIRKGISMMQKGDIVLLAGKGHETYQEIAGKKLPFDEHKIVREEIARQKRAAED